VELNDIARRNSAFLTVCSPAGNSTPGFNYAGTNGGVTCCSLLVLSLT
jgi:hypothetical protein